MKTAFLFAGQGAQKVGMGKDFYDAFPEVRALYDQHTLDFDIKKCCFEGPEEQLNDTAYAQSCLLITSYAIAMCLKHQGVTADVAAGLSLGEYTALTYAGVFHLEEALKVVRKRGRLMAEALPLGTGMMAAVIGATTEVIQKACETASEDGICEVANYNCPGQVVISGETKAVKRAAAILKDQGIRRVLPLKVSGAFHSSLLNQASKELGTVLDTVELRRTQLPVYSNVSGQVERGPLKEVLMRQMCSSVYFEAGIRQMLEDGVDTFVEIGPGKTLSGFVKKINRNVSVYHVEDLQSYEEVLKAFR